jgi:hypothetical protein
MIYNFTLAREADRFRKPKAACFLSYVGDKHNTNTRNIMKNRSH